VAPTDHLPSFVDDDELVLLDLTPNGAIKSMRSDITLQVNGFGDFSMRLPGKVKAVADLGGDVVPGLQDNQVSFLGFLQGPKVASVEATLDPARYASAIPLSAEFGYTRDGQKFDPSKPGTRGGAFTQTIDLHNLTARSETFYSGAPQPGPLAQELEALRCVSGIFTPETDLQQVCPMPAGLPMTAQQPVQRTTLVPLNFTVRVKLPVDAVLDSAEAAAVTQDSRGTQLQWTVWLPETVAGPADKSIAFAYHMPRFRMPGVQVDTIVFPLPASNFVPPGGGTWAQELKRQKDLAPSALLAQLGAASLHRVGDIAPPVGRPGPGPERPRFRLTIESGAIVKPKPAPPAPPRAQPWAVALALTMSVAAAAGAWLAWARN
jgi:hypothetical protein